MARKERRWITKEDKERVTTIRHGKLLRQRKTIIVPVEKRNDSPSVDNFHGLKKEKRACKKADAGEHKIRYDATISDDGCADSKSNVEENNRVPPSERSTNPEDEARSMKKCDDDRIKVQRSREVKNENTQRRQGHLENKNTTDVIAEPRKHGQNIGVKCKNNGSPGEKMIDHWMMLSMV